MIGCLIKGQFYCPDCANKHLSSQKEPQRIPISSSQIEPYSQRCNQCRRKIVFGSLPDLFPLASDPNVMDEDDVRKYVTEIEAHEATEDWEAYRSVLLQFAIHLLEAIHEDKLLCREVAFEQFFRFGKRSK